MLYPRSVRGYLALVWSALAWTAIAEGGVTYQVVDLGTLGGQYSEGRGINNLGQVCGFADLPDGNDRAFRTLANGAIDPLNDSLGTLGGTFSYALAINAGGQVTGYAATANDWAYHAFRTAPNSAIDPVTDDLGTLSSTPEFSYSQGNALNDNGQVAGLSDTTTWPFYPARAFRTAAGAAINPQTDNLGSLGGPYSEALGINSVGQAVGYADVSGVTAYHAFRTTPGGAIRPAIDDLGTLGGTSSYARDVADDGRCVGAAQTTGNAAWRAFKTTATGSITAAANLGTLGGTNSRANAINNNGLVVGASDTAGGQQHAFLHDGTGMADLNALIDPLSGWTLEVARDINDLGQVVGVGTHSGQTRGFLLIPVSLGFPTITGHPESQSVCGEAQPTVIFTVAAAAEGPVTYQWKKALTSLSDDGHFSGVTTPTLTVSQVTVADAGSYRCLVTYQSRALHSDVAILRVGTIPVITVQPQPVTVCPPATASFAVAFTSDADVLWEVSDDGGGNWNPAPGTNNLTTYTTPPVTKGDNGSQFRARVSNACATLYSDSVTLSAGPLVPPDFNEDCRVDLADFTHFEGCFTGPAQGPLATGCENADLDGDGDADQVDFGLFQKCFNPGGAETDLSCWP